MRWTDEGNKKADEKVEKTAHFLAENFGGAPRPVQPTCRQNEKSTKQREKPRAVISCDAMTTTRDGVHEF